MKFTSPVYSAASGSIAGITYSRNRGGLYTRARAVPTDPTTIRQQIVRTNFGTIAQAWPGLTGAQRAGWDLYGENVPVTDPLGASIQLSGQQWHQAINSVALQLGLPLFADAPAVFDRGAAPPLDLSLPAADAGAGGIDVAFDNSAAWATEDDAYLAVWQGRPQGAGIQFFRGPWRLLGNVAGDSMTPPTSPASFTSVFLSLAAGQQTWVRCRVLRADGRLSEPFTVGPTTAV